MSKSSEVVAENGLKITAYGVVGITGGGIATGIVLMLLRSIGGVALRWIEQRWF